MVQQITQTTTENNTSFDCAVYLWSRNKKLHSKLILDVNSFLELSTTDISLISCKHFNLTVQQKHTSSDDLDTSGSGSNAEGNKNNVLKTQRLIWVLQARRTS